MSTLNLEASRAMLKAGTHACSDVTGFGLLGHLREMADASGLTGCVKADAVPILPGVKELVTADHISGGTKRNLEWVDPVTKWAASVESTTKLILADAQTSGGLLIVLSKNDLERLDHALNEESVSDWAVIGEFTDRQAGGPSLIVE
jgi:selenide,water dikinase